jgi:hypothetical protein
MGLALDAEQASRRGAAEACALVRGGARGDGRAASTRGHAGRVNGGAGAGGSHRQAAAAAAARPPASR